jgi:hypothetical protein
LHLRFDDDLRLGLVVVVLVRFNWDVDLEDQEAVDHELVGEDVEQVLKEFWDGGVLKALVREYNGKLLGEVSSAIVPVPRGVLFKELAFLRLGLLTFE